MKILLLSLLLFCSSSCSIAESETTQPLEFRTAEEVQNSTIKNFYKLDSDLNRSGQPNKKGFQELEKKGIKSVLNLREYHSDKSEAKDTSIKLYRLRLAAGSLTEKELLEAMQLIQGAPKPLLIHCWHGSDRTGALCATYRIVEQNWTVEEAVNELVHGPYGHHKSTYKNIPALLNSIDWKKFKEELNKPSR